MNKKFSCFFLFSIKLSNPINKYIGEDICLVEPNPDQAGNYLIYLKNTKKILFGQLAYQPCGFNDYLYSIIIGEKLYQIKSSDLKNRRLTIIDTLKTKNSSIINSPQILFQVLDTFSNENKKYHVTINDTKHKYGYLAIVVLLNLLECKRNNC